MLNFTVEKIAVFDTPMAVLKLKRNGRCYIDEFWDEIKRDKNLSAESAELMAIILDAASNKLLPKSRFRKVSLAKSYAFNAFEAKSYSLRIYMIVEKNAGKILICGGRKKTQKNDIERLKRIMKEYYHFKK